jgi:hypothetical protein
MIFGVSDENCPVLYFPIQYLKKQDLQPACIILTSCHLFVFIVAISFVDESFFTQELTEDNPSKHPRHKLRCISIIKKYRLTLFVSSGGLRMMRDEMLFELGKKRDNPRIFGISDIKLFIEFFET